VAIMIDLMKMEKKCLVKFKLVAKM